jgi:hypothetical protein
MPTREELLRILQNAECFHVSDYMEARRAEIDGVQYRLIKQYAGRGKIRKALPLKIEYFDEGEGKWKSFVEEQERCG